MGQYYRIAMINNEGHLKAIQPSGWKLLEHSYYWNETMRRVEKLLFRNTWNCMRVWDYAECAPFVWKHEPEDFEKKSYDEDYSEDELLTRRDEWYYYLVNLDKKEFINMTRQEAEHIKIHPLPILCRMETEEAGWDYRECYHNWKHMWRRAWNNISIYYWTLTLEECFEKDGWNDMTDKYVFIE